MNRSRPSAARFLLPALLLLSACGDGLGPPDASWTVTLTSGADQVEGCGDATFDEISESYTYDMYAEGSSIDIFIDGQSFASGVYEDGCNISYESPSWLDSYDDAEIQWGISGRATVDGPAGGCVGEEGLDWDGLEEVTIVRSETEALPIGCKRTFDVTGTLGG